MRIYRLHEQDNIKRGPFQDWNRGFAKYAIQHCTPYAYRSSVERRKPRIWAAFKRRTAYCAWCSATKMRNMLMDPRHWPSILTDMVVSVIEVEHYCILPDGQVLFIWDSAKVVQTITNADELAALAEQENA